MQRQLALDAATAFRARAQQQLALVRAGDGTVLACVNSPDIGPSFLIDSMAEEAPQLHFERRLDNPPEFADIDPNSDLKALVFQQG